jgi:glycosyltransferase involved in cell wall biosynthesis
LKGLKTELGDQLRYLFLTADDTHDEAASILRPEDSLHCILHRIGRGNFAQSAELATRSKVIAAGLLKTERVNVLYFPFGTVQFASHQVPTVAMVADLLHRDYPYSLPAHTREWRELQFRKLVRFVDGFQVVSEYTAERLQSLYDIPPEQVFITRHPIHGRLTSVESSREPFFFYPANFWIHKNHETLLVAYQIYLSRTGVKPPWNLVLTGHPDERMATLQQIAVDLGVATHVKFAGHVAESDLAKLYATASCLVFPSLHEGYGIPIVEAMAFGVPVICGTNGSIPEIAGDAAFYADMRNPSKLADALLTVAGDEFLRQSLVALGREQLAAFDFSVEIRRLADLFKLVTARATPVQRHRGRHFDEVFSSAAYYGRAVARRALNAAVEVPVRVERLSSKIP